jgi:hypothetical protein
MMVYRQGSCSQTHKLAICQFGIEVKYRAWFMPMIMWVFARA